MTDHTVQAGMSKGMKITLIIIGVFVVLVVIATATCYVYREDIARFGIITLVNQMKAEIAANPVEGMDTAAFNRMADGFITRVNEGEFALDDFAPIGLSLQGAMDDKVLDSAEVAGFIETMIQIYPELGDQAESAPDTLAPDAPDSILAP